MVPGTVSGVSGRCGPVKDTVSGVSGRCGPVKDTAWTRRRFKCVKLICCDHRFKRDVWNITTSDCV